MEESLTSVPCAICGQPVRLQGCKLNDLGEPIHEVCLAEQLKEKIRKHKAALANWQKW